MAKRLGILVLLLVAGLFFPSSAQGQDWKSLQSQIEFARKKMYPALVNINVVVRGFSRGRSYRTFGAGSGAIVSPAGHVVTNFHVAQDTVRLICTLPSGERMRAKVVAHDPLTDLSILKLNLKDRKNPNAPLPYATFGDSSKLKVGDYVLAMGNPMSLSSSTTLGIVSNPSRVFTDFMGTDIARLDLGQGEVTGLFTQWIQHDALILPGNSGGPLVNLQGEIVGINELGGSGVGFAIPSNLCAQVLHQVLTDGKVNRSWSGLTILPVSKMGRNKGALVSSITPFSPAKKAGIKAGDIILSINGDEVKVRFFEEVPAFYLRLSSYPSGKEIEVTYLRDGKEKQARLTLEPLEKFLGKEAEFRSLGITVRNITSAMARARKYPHDRGVLVTGVRPGYLADEAKPRIRSGDVLLKIGKKEVKDLGDFEKIVRNLGDFEFKAVHFRRGTQSMVTALKRDKDKNSIMGGELEKPWLGVQTQVLTKNVARAMGLKGKRGFRITRVFPKTKAAQSGLKVGDVIVRFAGQKLRASRAQDRNELRRIVENRLIGEVVDVVVYRKGEKKTLKVELQETPQTAEKAKSYKVEVLELTVRELTWWDKVARRWELDQKGLLVSKVTSGGWASLAGLKANDLVLAIQGEKVTTIKGFEKTIKKVIEKKPEVIRFYIKRSTRTHFVFIEPDWKK